MANKTVDKYVIKVSTEGTNQAEAGLKKVDKASGKMLGGFSKLKVGATVLATALVAIGKHSLDTASKFETLQTRLNTMYGSVAQGTQAFNEFVKIASTTPFAVSSVVEAGASLKAFGMDAEESIKSVADLAAFMGVDVVEAASAMGRAFAGGAGAADMLRDRGVLQLIKDFKGLDDLSQLTLPEFRKALKEAVEDPTLGIAGATTALSQTFEGAYSNMGDAIEQLSAQIGSKLLPMATSAVKAITSMINGIRGVGSPSQEAVIALKAQQKEMNVLAGTIKDLNLPTDVRIQKIRELQKEYPDFLANMKAEAVTDQMIADELERLNELTQNKIEQIIQEEALNRAYERQKELISDVTKQYKLIDKSTKDFGEKLFELENRIEGVNDSSVRGAIIEQKLAEDFYLTGGASQWLGDNMKNLITDVSNLYQEYDNGNITQKAYNEGLKDILENSGLVSWKHQEHMTFLGRLIQKEEELVEANDKLNSTYQQTQDEIEYTNQVLKDLNKTQEDLAGDEDPIIPPPSKETLKEYDTIIKAVTGLVKSYQRDVSKFSKDIQKSELALLESAGKETLDAVVAINEKKKSMLADQQQEEIQDLQKQQDAILEQLQIQLDHGIEHNTMTKEEQEKHKQDMLDLEEQYSQDMLDLKTVHSNETATLNNETNAEEYDLKKEHLDSLVELQKNFNENLKTQTEETLEAQNQFQSKSESLQMSLMQSFVNANKASIVQTKSFIQDEAILKQMRNSDDFDRLSEWNEISYKQNEENLIRNRELVGQSKEKEIQLLREKFNMDGVITQEEQDKIALKMIEFNEWVASTDADHKQALEENEKLYQQNMTGIKNKFERQQKAITRQAKQAEINMYVDTFNNVASAFADNAGDLFNMNKDDKKKTLQLEKAIAYGMGYKEIAGIWSAEPQGLKGVPVKTALTIAAGLRTAGNVARIQQQIEALDQVAKPDVSGGTAGNYSLGSESAAIGYSGVIDSPTNLLVGEAGSEMVNVTPLDNRSETPAETVVNITGNVMSKDYVEGELADAIQEAVRRGSVFGL